MLVMRSVIAVVVVLVDLQTFALAMAFVGQQPLFAHASVALPVRRATSSALEELRIPAMGTAPAIQLMATALATATPFPVIGMAAHAAAVSMDTLDHRALAHVFMVTRTGPLACALSLGLGLPVISRAQASLPLVPSVMGKERVFGATSTRQGSASVTRTITRLIAPYIAHLPCVRELRISSLMGSATPRPANALASTTPFKGFGRTQVPDARLVNCFIGAHRA
jgi:hypothetical protein